MTDLKKYKDKIKWEVFKKYDEYDGEKSEVIDLLSEKYHISVSTVYNYVREGRKNEMKLLKS